MKKTDRKTLRTLMIALIAVCLVIVAAFLLLIAPAFVETTLPNNSYVIEVTGLSGLTVNGTATVMVPVPANADGDPVMTGDAFAEGRVEGWTGAIRETPYGTMLAFTTTESDPPDIFAPFGEMEKKEDRDPSRRSIARLPS